MHNFFIGIMSGTSADSLDGCIVSFENEFKLIETESVDFGKNYKKIYEECIKSGYKVISDSSKLLQIEKISIYFQPPGPHTYCYLIVSCCCCCWRRWWLLQGLLLLGQ